MSNPKFDVAAARIRCRKFRKRILDITQTAGALHIAPAFSCLELVDTAYFGLMRRTGDPETDDTFILSKGHGSLAKGTYWARSVEVSQPCLNSRG